MPSATAIVDSVFPGSIRNVSSSTISGRGFRVSCCSTMESIDKDSGYWETLGKAVAFAQKWRLIHLRGTTVFRATVRCAACHREPLPSQRGQEVRQEKTTSHRVRRSLDSRSCDVEGFEPLRSHPCAPFISAQGPVPHQDREGYKEEGLRCGDRMTLR